MDRNAGVLSKGRVLSLFGIALSVRVQMKKTRTAAINAEMKKFKRIRMGEAEREAEMRDWAVGESMAIR